MPTTVPPKYIYQIQYHPTSLPDFDMKFEDHKHFNDWNTIVYGELDKYEFQYKNNNKGIQVNGGTLSGFQVE